MSPVSAPGLVLVARELRAGRAAGFRAGQEARPVMIVTDFPQDFAGCRSRSWKASPRAVALNAHYTPATLAAEFARLRDTAG
jgi:hypothetical protein